MSRRIRPVMTAVVLTCGLVGLLAPPSDAVQTPQERVVSADPVNSTPHVLDGSVKAIMQVGNRIIVGGIFTQVRSATSQTVIARTNLFAFDATTGAIDTGFVPSVNGEVEALAAGADGRSVFIGGAFTTVNGAANRSVAKLDTVTGLAVGGFRATTTNARVRTLVLRANLLYVGGAFTVMNGQNRTALAGLDANTGTVVPSLNLVFAGPRGGGVLQVVKLDVTPDASRLVAIGNFSSVAGQARHQIVHVNLATSPATLADWSTTRYEQQCSPSFQTYMRDVDFSPDGSYFVVVTTGAHVAGSLCDTAARWETAATGSALQPAWVNDTGGDTLLSVAVTGHVVYVGGHQRWANNPFGADFAGPGAVSREGIAALDPVNGMPLSWNPGRTRGVGVFDLYATSSGLYVGSDTDRIGNYEYHGRVAMFPLAGGTVIPPRDVPALPTNLYRARLDDTLERRSFDGTVAGPAALVGGTGWSHARGGFMLNGRVYTGWDDGKLYVRTFDGTTFGPPAALNLYGLTAQHFPVANITGMFFDRGYLYYTVAGDPRMFSRYFGHESGIVGADTFVVSGNGDGLDWRDVAGMTLASGRVYAGRNDGNLVRTDFTTGRPVPGTTAVVSGPATGDGNDWRGTALFAFEG